MVKNCNNPRFKRTHLSCLRERKVKASSKNCVRVHPAAFKEIQYIRTVRIQREHSLLSKTARLSGNLLCKLKKPNLDYFLFQRARNVSKHELNVSIQPRLIGKAAFVSQHSRFSNICGVRTTSFLNLVDNIGSCSSDQDNLQ